MLLLIFGDNLSSNHNSFLIFPHIQLYYPQSNIDSFSLNDNSNGSQNYNYSCLIVFKHGSNYSIKFILLTDMSPLMKFCSDIIVLTFTSLGVTHHIECVILGLNYLPLDTNSPE